MTKVFISYSHLDEPYRNELEKHLAVLKRNGYIDTWTDRKIIPGEEWKNSIQEELLSAKIILLLISSDFLASDFCYDIEMKTAVKRHQANDAIVIPIILRFCDWSNTPFSDLQGLPSGGQPIKDWVDSDKAFLNVIEGIKIAINILKDGNQSGNAKLGVSPSEKISELRTRVLCAKDELDFRRLQFDLNEFRKGHPLSFELEELERLVDRGLRYEQRPVGAPSPMYKKRPGFLLNFFVLLIIALLIYLVIHFFN
jgi:hypothetical protein